MVNSMINGVNLKVNIDDYILSALKEDITSDDVTTNAVMPEAKLGHVDLKTGWDRLWFRGIRTDF